MTTYLNKEAVLKAAKDAMTWPEHAAGLVMRIERGEFDATPGPLIMAYTADKDAEIARLKKELCFVSSSAGIRGKSILASFRIIGDLKARIAELEKLTESQQGIINQQTEARQKARANMAKELSTIIQQEWQCSLPEILYIIECVEKGKYKEFPKPAQKKPDLNTENLIEDLQDQCAELRSRVYPGMAEDIGGLIPRLDNLESRLAFEGKAQQEQNAAISKHTEQIHSLESGIQHHNARLHEIEQRQGRDRAKIMGEIKDQREDYHAHIRQLVEENGLSHKELSKAIEALRDAVAEKK